MLLGLSSWCLRQWRKTLKSRNVESHKILDAYQLLSIDKLPDMKQLVGILSNKPVN